MSTDPNGNATFSITVTNSTTSKITLTKASITDGSFVTIDTIKPVITITDASNNTVLQGNTYSDPGTEITDANNASYDGVISATALDTSILGAQNITYSAPADAAGNIPDPVNRTVTVLAKPLGLVSLNIAGNNSVNSTSYVKLGDQITINFTANGTISRAVINITDTSNVYTTSDNNILVNYTLDDSFKDANGVAFNITVYNEDNTTSTVFTHDNLTNTNLIIDSTPPNITLNGDSTITVYTNTIFDDENATAYDLSYGSITITGTGTVDTATPDTYTLSYAAPDDYAGNTGQSTTRTILVTNAPDINITALTISSSSSNNFARADQTITLMLYTDSSDLTNATGTFLNREFTSSLVNGNANFTILVDSTDTNGNATFSITVTNSTTSKITLTKASITDGSFVTIDTVKPVIALNGNSPDTVFRGNSYTDQGVIISDDGNNSYPQTFTASITDLDTSSLGAQNITYSAPSDAAGNIPDSINRTVTVLAKPLAITTLTITSSNANSSYAKTGDVITLNLVANGTIGSSTTVSIASTTPTPTITGQSLEARYTVESSLADTNSLAFTITTSNEDNLQTVTSTQANLPGSSIIIDNTAPTIILQGDDPFPVYTNTTFTDPGALANDHSYGNQTINTTDTPSTSVSGTFTVNYKAPDDYAGNTGPSITRTILVTDAPKINITALNISSSSSNNFARAGQTITLMLYTDSSDLTNATGTFLNREFTSSLVNGNANFTILVDSTDPNGNATFSISMDKLD